MARVAAQSTFEPCGLVAEKTNTTSSIHTKFIYIPTGGYPLELLWVNLELCPRKQHNAQRHCEEDPDRDSAPKSLGRHWRYSSTRRIRRTTFPVA